MLEPLWKDRSVVIKGSQTFLVVSDLHLGFELELILSGVYVPDQTDRLADYILKIGRRTGANVLILNGDLKHTIGTMRPVIEKVVKFISTLKDYFSEIILVKGNHDGGMRGVKEIRVVDGRGIGVDDVWIFHGHAMPPPNSSKFDVGIMGHVHPTLKLRGRTEPVWVLADSICKGLPKRILIMPPFNPLTGYGILTDVKERGPVFPKCVDPDETYILDEGGELLGTLSELS